MRFFVGLTVALLLLVLPFQIEDKKNEVFANSYVPVSAPVSLIINQTLEKETPPKEEIIEITKPEIDIPLSEEMQDHIWELCQKYDLSYELVLALIKNESNFRTKVVSYNNSSLGLMQLNKNTYPDLAKELQIKNFDPFNPKHNSRAGIYYLAKIREELREKDLMDEEITSMMLMTYHRGRSGASRYAKRYGLNSKYINKIMQQKYEYEKG